jgi:hypothetical protein
LLSIRNASYNYIHLPSSRHCSIGWNLQHLRYLALHLWSSSKFRRTCEPAHHFRHSCDIPHRFLKRCSLSPCTDHGRGFGWWVNKGKFWKGARDFVSFVDRKAETKLIKDRYQGGGCYYTPSNLSEGQAYLIESTMSFILLYLFHSLFSSPRCIT